MTLTETVNMFRLNQVIGLYPHLRSNFELFNDNDNGEQYYKTLLPILETYLHRINIINDDIGYCKVEYLPPKNNRKVEDDGIKRRVYPKGAVGLVSFPRDIRNYLLHDNHNEPLVIDFDIQNCHPVIYYQFLLKNGFPHDNLLLLKDYIENRENWIEVYGQNIKTYIISTINGAQQLSIEDPSITTEQFEKLDSLVREIWTTHNWIQHTWKLEGLTELKDFIFKKNTEIEAKITQVAMEFARQYSQNDNIISIYAYDGFAVHRNGIFKNPVEVEKFIGLLNKKVIEETGYTCIFVDKPLKVCSKLQEFLDNTPLDKPNGRESYDISLESGQFLGDVITENIFTDFKEDIIVFKSGMGVGKTALAMRCIQQLRTQGITTSTLSILNRISLIDNLKHDYPFLYSYREDGDNRDIHGVYKSVVVCSESLYRLTLETKQSCEYLILDEIMSLLPQMVCGETHGKNLKMNQQILLGLIKSVKKIVILDANISNSTIDFIKSIRGSSDGGEKNNHTKLFTVEPRKKRNIKYVSNIQHEMVMSLMDGKRLFVCCTRSIKFGEGIIRYMQGLFPEKKMVYINSETKGDTVIADLLRDTRLWGNYDLVMISPSISTGVSCVLTDTFDEVFCFFTPSSTNPLDASQQIGRVRYPKTENIYINIAQNPNPTYRFGCRTREQVLKMIYNNIHNLYKDNSHLVDTEFNYENFKETLQRTPRTELFLFNYAEQSKLYTNYRACLRQALENTYICNFSNDGDQLIQLELDIREQTKIRGEEYMNEKATSIFKSTNLTETEYTALENKQKRGLNLSKAELYTMEKYWLSINSKIQSYGLDEFVENNNKREPYTLFKVLNSKIPAVVKPLNRFIKNLRGTTTESDNTDFLTRLFDPVNFNLTDFTDTNEITTKWLADTHNGIMLRYIWVEKVVKIFGSRHLWDNIKLTDQEFKQKFKKFVEWLQLLCVPLNHGVFNFNRIMDLFALKNRDGRPHTLKSLQKLAHITDFKLVINQILRPLGMSFRSERIQKQVKGVKTSTQIFTLQLNYPVLLNYYLEPEPTKFITDNKDYLQLNRDTIPVITTGGIPTMTDKWIELYKSSVFFHLPQIRCGEVDVDKDEKDDDN